MAFGITGLLALLAMPARAQGDLVTWATRRAALGIGWLEALPPPVVLIVLGALIVGLAARRRVRELTSRPSGS